MAVTLAMKTWTRQLSGTSPRQCTWMRGWPSLCFQHQVQKRRPSPQLRKQYDSIKPSFRTFPWLRWVELMDITQLRKWLKIHVWGSPGFQSQHTALPSSATPIFYLNYRFRPSPDSLLFWEIAGFCLWALNLRHEFANHSPWIIQRNHKAVPSPRKLPDLVDLGTWTTSRKKIKIKCLLASAAFKEGRGYWEMTINVL